MKNTKRDKCIENFLLAFSVVFLILCFVSTVFILIFSDNLTSDLGYLGFNGFQEIFSFPIKSLLLFTTFIGLHIATKKYKQSDKHFKVATLDRNRGLNTYPPLKKLMEVLTG